MLPKNQNEILTKCIKFVKEYKIYRNLNKNEENLFHDQNWKECITKQKKVIDGIFSIM